MKINIYDHEIMEMLSEASLPICTCVLFTMKDKSMVEGYREMAKSLIKLEEELYVTKPPMIEFSEFEKAMNAKNKEIARLKEYMEVNDELSTYKLALNETVKELIVKPLVKDIVNNYCKTGDAE